ncbi:MAG: RAD55 family ATPase [Nanoarchaeota archaeon]|nr:RAD55 family ATPase [Nanoarchaeota archaeon]
MTLTTSLPKNSAALLIGPPLSGEKQVLFSYLLESLNNSTPVLLISTDKSPEEIKKDMLQMKIFVTKFETAKLLKYIDCYSKQTDESIKDTDCIRRVSGPLALNEISIALSDIERDFIRLNPAHNVIFSSLSTLLMYSNPQMVGRFLQVIIAKVKKAGGSILLTMEEGMHDEKVIVTIEHLMDAIIHVKKEGDKTMIRADGVPGFEKWSEFSG